MSRIHELLFTGIENKPLSPNRGLPAHVRQYPEEARPASRESEDRPTHTLRRSAKYVDRESFFRGCHSSNQRESERLFCKSVRRRTKKRDHRGETAALLIRDYDDGTAARRDDRCGCRHNVPRFRCGQRDPDRLRREPSAASISSIAH